MFKLLCLMTILTLSFLMAYLRYRYALNSLNQSRFFSELSDRLYRNLSGEMKKLCDVYNDVYFETFGKKIAFKTTEEVLCSLEKEFAEAENISEIKSGLSKYSVSNGAEIYKTAENLCLTTKKGVEISENKFIKYGKTAFIIYPGVSAMLILMVL